jgi:hypothetical protein
MNDVRSHIEKVRYDASQQYTNFAGADGVKTDINKAVESFKYNFAVLMNKNKDAVVNILNKNGFPTSTKEDSYNVIVNSLKAIQVSKKFQDDLVNLITMKKNFADQSQGLIRSLNANDLRSGVVNDGMFVKNNNFVPNCKDCNGGSYKNASGWLGDLIDVAKFGATTWSDSKQRDLEAAQAAAAQAVSASEIQKLQLEIQKLETEKDTSTAKDKSGSSATVKIIAVAGAFIIVGIATYFIFKKKKIN